MVCFSHGEGFMKRLEMLRREVLLNLELIFLC